MKNHKNSFLYVLVMIATLFLTSCATEKVAMQPQAPEVNEKVSPGPTYSLRGPEWTWDPTQKAYVFVAPEYVERPQGVWVRGHWRPVKGGMRWVPGHWQ